MIWQSNNKKWTIIRIDLAGGHYAAIINDHSNGKTFTATGQDCGTYFSVAGQFEGTKQDIPRYLRDAISEAVSAHKAEVEEFHDDIFDDEGDQDDEELTEEELEALGDIEEPPANDVDYKKKKGSIFERFAVLPGSQEWGSKIPDPPDHMLDPVIEIGDGIKISPRDMQSVLWALNEIREGGVVRVSPDLAKLVVHHLNEMDVEHSLHRDWDGKVLITQMDPDLTVDLTPGQKYIFHSTYAAHLMSMGTDMRAKHTADHLDKVIWDQSDGCLKVYYDNGNWWHYDRGAWW